MLRAVKSSSLSLTTASLVFAAACGARSDLGVPAEQQQPPKGGEAGLGGGGSTNDGGAPAIVGGMGGEGGMGGDGNEGGSPPECEPGTLLVYLVSQNDNLYRYNPATGALVLKGTLECDTMGNASPFSMSVDRVGRAYVVYTDGNLYRVDVGDASCEPTEYEPAQLDFFTFGMGFARDLENETDQLFVSDISISGTPEALSQGLATIDTETMTLSLVGTYDTALTNRMEMTSSNDGNLYGFALDQVSGGSIVRLDKTNADVLEQTFLPIGTPGAALAFAFWSDDFYIFTTGGNGTLVTRYRPADGSVVQTQELGDVIVGAGVSTCDPM